jgi:phosphonopyruvate decarboxylase
MKILQACDCIVQASPDAIRVATMGAMNTLDRLGVEQPRLNSVPLMGGAPSLALGLALGLPEQKVVVFDGDASLLMQLGGLVSVAGQGPRNFYHFVMHNGTQFTGLSNLPIAGPRSVDFCQLAEGAGYRRVYAIHDIDTLQDRLPEIFGGEGPVMVELIIEPEPQSFSADNPQQDWTDRQFTRMGVEARQLQAWLAQEEAA